MSDQAKPSKNRRGGWTKDEAGATAAACGVYAEALAIISETARNLHSNYANTIGAVGAAALAVLAYRLMLRLMRRLP